MTLNAFAPVVSVCGLTVVKPSTGLENKTLQLTGFALVIVSEGVMLIVGAVISANKKLQQDKLFSKQAEDAANAQGTRFGSP